MKTLHRFLSLSLLLAFFFAGYSYSEGKKIKQSLKIEKTKKNSAESTAPDSALAAIELPADTICSFTLPSGDTTLFNPSSIVFSGYDKQVNSRKESFFITNNSALRLVGYKITITYRDLKGRMLHSRTFCGECNVPQGETRKTDIPAWDTQQSFYYYLSNEPRKTAAPYKVEFTPLSFSVTY